MPSVRLRCLFISLLFLGVDVKVTIGQVPKSAIESKMTFVTENCYKAEIGAIVGVDTSACLIYDAKEQSGIFEFKFCGGFYFDIKERLFGVGGGAGGEKKACLKYEAKIKAKSEDEIIKKLEDKGKDGQMIKDKLLDEIKREMRLLPDETLKKIGIAREQIDGIQTLELKSIHNENGNSDKIKKALEKCPPLSFKPIS